VALELNVTRHPYSFIGDARADAGGMPGYQKGVPPKETWHDALLGYMGGDPVARAQAEAGMLAQGAAAGIQFNYDVLAQWQPVESQRLLLWAARSGLQEEFMSALNRRHFELQQSASERTTLLAAAREVGLDADAATAFLDSSELEDDVWRSYGRTIRELRIHSIPLFALSVPTLDAIGGPFRAPGAYEAYIVRGSMDAEYFLTLFEVLLRDVRAGQRVYDVRAAPYPRDEWHHQRSGTRVKTFETPVARDASVVCTTGGECNGGECPQ